jgi:hypothetical protein
MMMQGPANVNNKLIQSNTTQVYFNSLCYLYMCATCFDLYLGHPQACQYNNLTNEDEIRI